MTDTLIHGLYREGEKIADAKAPHDVPIAQRWEQRKFTAALVNPANRRKLRVIIVGSGLAGGAAAASLGEMGYNIDVFFYQDSAVRTPSPRRVVSTPRRTTATTTTPSTVSSTTRSRAATTALVRTTSTASPRSAPTSSTSASRRVSPSPASTAASSTTAPSVACRCPVRSTHVARRVSSC